MSYLAEKILKGLTIVVYQHSQSPRFFVNVSNFLKKMCNLFRYVAILLSSMQCVEGFLVTLKTIIDVQLCLNDQ